jgi:ribonuclease E
LKRKILINARTPEELRIAILAGDKLENFQVEAAEIGLTRGNIYRGIVTSLQPSLGAAFVDYGAQRNGFLPAHDVVDQAAHKHPKSKHPRLEEVLETGRPIVVQVVKDAEGSKGAALTTNLSLPGRYLVLTPWDSTRGVSRKVEDDEVRQQLKAQVESLKVPPGAGFIVRTNAVDQTKTTLNRDFTALTRLWKRIEADGKKGRSPELLYNDQDIILRTLRDLLDTDVEEVLVDNDTAFERAQEYVGLFVPRGKVRVVRYDDRVPLFARYRVEEMIDSIYDRTVPLRSGGSIVIDRTEALVAIDVNSGKATRGANIEETALQTNLEAASEVGRQLRLRDIGGLIVVDFIDMNSRKNRARIEKEMRDAMKTDRARSRIGRLSANGLLEINRQRLQQALDLRTQRRCPTCGGTGRIASPEMISLNLLRRIEAKAATGGWERVRIELHPELADAMQNNRRREISDLEREFSMKIEIIAAPGLHRNEQAVTWSERRVELPRPPEKPAAPAPRQPEPAAAAAAPPETAEGAERKRKRRRGRKKRGGAETTPPEAETTSAIEPETGAPHHEPATAEAPAHVWAWEPDEIPPHTPSTQEHEEHDEDDEHDEHEDEETPHGAAPAEGGEPRRKRRRGRRRRGARPGDAAPADTPAPSDRKLPVAPTPVAAAQSEPSAPASAEVASVSSQEEHEAGAPAAPARRKRRRSRAKKHPAAESGTEGATEIEPGAVTPPRPAPPPAPPEAAPQPEPETAAPAAATKSPAKKRRPRRKKAEAGDTAAPAVEVAPAAPELAPPAEIPRRRRQPKKKEDEGEQA